MVVSSKVTSNDKRDQAQELEERRKKLLKVISPCVFLILCEQTSLVQARYQAVFSLNYSDKVRTVQTLSSMMGIGAVMEFIANPLIGALSDFWGRKPTLLTSLVLITYMRFSVYFTGANLRSVTFERILSMTLITGIFTTLRAAESDCSSTGTQLALSTGQVARWAGVGAFIGPYLNQVFERLFGPQAKNIYLGTSILSLANCLLIFSTFEETLGDEKDKRFNFRACNPFSFLDMMQNSSTIRLLMLLSLLQTFGDARNLEAVNTAFMQQHLKWGKTQIGNMLAALGAIMVVGSFFAESSIMKLGLRAHTALSNFCQFTAYILWGLAPARYPYDIILTHLSILFALGAQRKRDAVESLVTKIAVQKGIGKGHIASNLSNWRSIASVVSPILLGNAYVWGTENPGKMYLPGMPFLALAFLTAVAEHTFRSIPDSELDLDSENYRRVGSEEPKTLAPQGKKKASYSIGANNNSKIQKFLNKTRQNIVLSEKINISHDTRLFRFVLPDKNMILGLPTGKHIKFWCPNPKAVVEGEWNCRKDPEFAKKEIERKYTPTSSDDDLGRIDVVIKVYKGEIKSKFPDGGKMSQYLDSLSIGQRIDIAGPFGLIEYKGRGKFEIRKKAKHYEHVGMMAGGTGITPMLQIIKAVLKDPLDTTTLSLLYANQTEQDILIRDMLEEEARKHPARFRIWYTLDNPPANWNYSKGFIDENMIRTSMPPPSDDTLILMCGPPPMIKFACKPNLEKLKYNPATYIEF